MAAYTIRVTGVVQGVFFRASTQKKAEALGIQGWVRNEPDGSVLISAEGEETVLGEFLQWCHHGPPQAKVDEVIVTEEGEDGFTGFEIRR